MDLLESAINFAAEAHSGQKRKMSDIPYILHPMEVATIIGTMTSSPEVIAAGLLHDTIEDTPATEEDISANFGLRVLELVLSETEDKMVDRPPCDTWRERKELSLIFLRDTDDIDIKMLWLSDKLSNIRSFCREYERSGDAIWSHLHQKDPAMQKWYYYTIAEYTSELKDTFAYREYIERLAVLFGK